LSTIRLLIANDKADLPLSGVAEALSRLPDFDVVGGRIVPIRQVEPLLREQQLDVLILVGDGSDLDEFARQLVLREQRVTVLRLTIVPPSLQIRPSVTQFGIGELVDTLRVIVRFSGAPSRARLLRKQFAAPKLGLQDRAEVSACLKAARLWLNALLKGHIVRDLGRKSEDLPGLTIGRDTVVGLLDQDAIVSPEDASTALRWAAFEAAIAAEKDSTPIAILCDQLGLTELECKALLLCLAPELDTRYQRAFGYLHDDYGRRYASLGLIGLLLGDPLAVRSSLAASGGLRRWHLVEAGLSAWGADEPLRVDRAVLGWLTEHRSLLHGDLQLRRAVRPTAWPGASIADPDDADRERLSTHLATSSPGARILLAGEEPESWRIRVEAAAIAIGAEPIRIEAAALSGLAATELEEFAARIARIVKLFKVIPVIDTTGIAVENLSSIALILPQITAACSHPLFIIVDSPERSRELFSGATAIVERPMTTSAERSEALLTIASMAGIAVTQEDADRFATTYTLAAGDIALAVEFAQALAAGEPGRPAVGGIQIATACRRIASPRLPSFARRIEPTFDLEQVVLPEDRHRQLREIIANVKYASTVFGKWRFAEHMPYGRGVTVLFSGQPGTGKAMAAHAIAKALMRIVYSVDLAQLPSKYIGETNKNFEIVFAEAERSGAVVQIDEADAFFGKRSEVKDAHDRYANLEVAYLLQRIEAFTGLAILTTNFRQNLDPAFLRRFRFTLDFPVPDATAREAIWRQCLAGAPLGDDIDYRFIARRLELTGGNIRQITLCAAFAAAADGAAIGMKHLVEATRAELSKIGMHQAERELAERAA
jgi:AAA+ superfamily predicted ATPase